MTEAIYVSVEEPNTSIYARVLLKTRSGTEAMSPTRAEKIGVMLIRAAEEARLMEEGWAPP